MLIWVVAGGTYFWRLLAHKLISTYQTLPGYGLVAFPESTGLDAVEIALEALHMMLLYRGDSLEMLGYFGESLLFGHFGIGKISLYSLIALLMYGYLEIGDGVLGRNSIDGDIAGKLSTLKHLQIYLAMT